MERPKIEDFKPEYTKGVAEIASVAKQFVKAQALYIDHLEQLLIHSVVNCLSCGKKHAELCGSCVSDIAQATGEQAQQSR